MTAKKKRSVGKRIRRGLLFLFLGLFLAAAAFFAYVWFMPMTERDIWDFVPEDTVYVLEADDPIENWKSFSDTKIWRHLKENALFADIQADADYMDTLVHDHDKLFKLISGKKLLICAQMTKANDYDFLYLMDLKKGAKVKYFLDVFRGILSPLGISMTKRIVGEKEIFTVGEGEDAIQLAFQDNIMLISYTNKLVINSLQQYNRPFFSRHSIFNKLKKRVYKLGNRQTLVKFYLNYAQLDEFMSVYMDQVTETVISLSEIMEFSAFDLKMQDDMAQMAGYTAVDESKPSLLNVMQEIQRSEIRSHNILPVNTSFFLSLNFHDFDYFYAQIATLMADDASFQDFQKTRDKIGGFLGVSKSDKKIDRKRRKGKDVDYFDWIGQEIGLAMVPANESGSKQAYLALFHTPDRANAAHDLKELEKRIKNRTPVRFKQYSYRDHEISYLHLKGFFKLFLGKLFKKFDKPKYTILEDFVIFSNDTSAIHRVIDVAHGGRANMLMDGDFRRFFSKFETNSNYFLYVNNLQLYPYLPSMGDAETARGIRNNKRFITCFPRVGLQLVAEDGMFTSELFAEFEPEARKTLWDKVIGQ